MTDCMIYLPPPNIKQTFDLHHVVYLTHIYLNLLSLIRMKTPRLEEEIKLVEEY
jgi:hypothetical protein